MEIKFKRDTSFRKQFFVPDSFAHPAKMDAQLLIWLTENYTSVGEVILDPMAGSGTTMLACTLGRNCILVELEEKFCKMMVDNWQEVRMRPQLGYSMGDCQIIQGNARNLEGLLADKIITSPPYAEATHHGDDPAELEHLRPGRSARVSGTAGNNENNIGQLPYGNIDKIITSPPYDEGLSRRHKSSGIKDDNRLAQTGSYKTVDKIISSPPYSEGGQGVGKEYHPERMVGNTTGLGRGYSEDAGNIGNLKGDTYLEAMLQVYSQCFTMLRDGGLLILVTKNFIRNKQVIRLDSDTMKLCEQAGFGFVERHFRRLPAQSFWRTIYQQKYPEVEVIQNEDVLVFNKL